MYAISGIFLRKTVSFIVERCPIVNERYALFLGISLEHLIDLLDLLRWVLDSIAPIVLVGWKERAENDLAAYSLGSGNH